ncbi:MAG: SDR family oxidoreductase [Alphaproteobacteria bacterium]|nr:SDR family oxidoreductase [Alphaproteobacteria bacterium]
MDRESDDQTARPPGALVTGAARGIGRAIAARLARGGTRVVMLDRDGAAVRSAAAETEAAGGLEADVADAGSVERAVADAERILGGIDILVCNAAIMDRAPFLEMDSGLWWRVLEVNLGGAFLCGQAVARGMVARGRGGRIVNVASNSGLFGGRGRAAYGASKAGLINLTQTMAIELAEHGILVNAVAPGPTRTREEQPAEPGPTVMQRMPLRRFGRPEEIAEVAAFLASPALTFTTGHVYAADGGFTIAGMMEG